MWLKYFLLVFLYRTQVWSDSVLSIELQHAFPHESHQFSDSGEPLFLTYYIRANLTNTARRLSNVKAFGEGDKNITSNSGFLTVNDTFNVNLFFWFFRKTSEDWEKAPLLLWLQGGPGCSSMRGVFEENGPYIYTKKGVKQRKFSWTNDYNVLYIDQPVGSGFSFTNSTDGLVRNPQQAAEHLYEAVIQFLQLYPELKGNEFYATGESYAARFLAVLAHKIHILKVAGKCKINLKGLFLVSADIDGAGLMKGFGDVCFQIGLIDSKMRNEIKAMEEELKSKVHSKMWKDASQEKNSIYKKVVDHSNVNFFDYTKLDEDNDRNRYEKFFQSPDVRRKIHVGNTSYYDCSLRVYRNFYDDLMKNVRPYVETLLEYYPITIVGGQYDLAVPYHLNFDVLKSLEWSGAYQYSKEKREKLRSRRRIVGFYKSAGNLNNILIRGAGHMVPKDQPRVVLNLLNEMTREDDSEN